MTTQGPSASDFELASVGNAMKVLEECELSVLFGTPFSPDPDATLPPILLSKGECTAKTGAGQPVRTKPARAKNIQRKPALPFPVPVDGASLRTLQNNSGLLTRLFGWIRTHRLGRSSTRRLQVAATVSLGEKRFVAVIRIDGMEFLIGGGATNVALLAQLSKKDSFGDLLHENMTVSQEAIGGPAIKKTRKRA
jgi:hypothetical protein